MFVCLCAGLHPLQRALLIQNQQIQQFQAPPQTPPTAIPHHMTTPQGVAPHTGGSPVVQSPTPSPLVPAAIPNAAAYTVPVVQPHTPLPHQQNIFSLPPTAPPGTPATFDPSGVMVPQAQVVSSKVLQKPMSKLAYVGSTPELLQYPDPSSVDRPVGGPPVGGTPGGGSQVNPELVDRELARLWSRHSEQLAKQVSNKASSRYRK